MTVGLFDYYGQLCATANTWTCQMAQNASDANVTTVAAPLAVTQNGTALFDHVTISGAPPSLSFPPGGIL